MRQDKQYIVQYMIEIQIHIKLFGGEAGQRTLNALKQIVNAARTGKETKPSATLNINANNAKWEIDNIDKNYLSKEFTVTAAAGIKEYVINLSGTTIEGTKITDINNVEKNMFSKDEKFKILIPITNMDKDGNFTINANGEVATKPVIYGLAPSSNLQNTALTGSIYEAGSGTKTEYYFQNQTKIVILKQNQDTKNPLQGVKFNLLNGNKEIICAGLTTNEEGIIEIDNLLPGKYYIQETETLERYEVYDKLIEVDAKFNEEIKVAVNNLYNEDIPKSEKTETEIEVEQVKSEIEINQNKEKVKLPKTGM